MSLYNRYGKQTVQTLPISGKNMVKNHAGGYVFKIEPVKWFERFLAMGITDSIYYCKEWKFDQSMQDGLEAFMQDHSEIALDMVIDFIQNDRAVNLSPVLFAYAFICKKANEPTRSRAFSMITEIIRIPTQLFEFIDYCQNIGGWSRSMRTAINKWYLSKSYENLAYHLVKYRQRNGWKHHDIWNLSHIRSVAKGDKDELIAFMYNEEGDLPKNVPSVLKGYLEAKTLSGDALVQCIHNYGLTREMIPTAELNTAPVQKALIFSGMPMTAMVRNISTFSRVGLNDDVEVIERVTQVLSDRENIKKSHLHPYALFKAWKNYHMGHGIRSEWDVNHKLADALESAFNVSFDYIEPTGNKILIAVDGSGSMRNPYQEGDNVTSLEVASILALSFYKAEKNVITMSYDTRVKKFSLNERDTLRSTLNKIDTDSGGTDCSVPMNYAIETNLHVDAFILITDNETWAGMNHPAQALNKYRTQIGNPYVKIIVIGLASTEFSIADPDDKNALNISGFSADTPRVIANFLNS